MPSLVSPLKAYCQSLVNPKLAPTAFKVALVVGTVLMGINHGAAILKGQMSRDRWISACLTYVIPYLVNIHGQHVRDTRSSQPIQQPSLEKIGSDQRF